MKYTETLIKIIWNIYIKLHSSYQKFKTIHVLQSIPYKLQSMHTCTHTMRHVKVIN